MTEFAVLLSLVKVDKIVVHCFSAIMEVVLFSMVYVSKVSGVFLAQTIDTNQLIGQSIRFYNPLSWTILFGFFVAISAPFTQNRK